MSNLRSLLTTIALLSITACATPRSNPILGIAYSDQPARVALRWECNGQTFTTQGTGVCEQKAPSQAKVSVKIPPIEGRVIYSNGQLKKTEDFNWAPKEGVWFWKKKPLPDTWAELDLGEIAATYGDWPVALDVAGVDPKSGVIVTRGMLYHRVCNDRDVPCSRLVLKYECSGEQRETGEGRIGKCERMSGSSQALRVALTGPGYSSKPGAKVYVSVPRMGIDGMSDSPTAKDFEDGEFKVNLNALPTGPTLVGVRLAWIEDGKLQQVETRVLLMGFSPGWTGLDRPHWLETAGGGLQFVRPVLADLMEVNLYEGRGLTKKNVTDDKTQSIPRPQGSQIACVFAWQRDSSDQTYLCLDSQLREVALP